MDHVEVLWDIEQIKRVKAWYFRFIDTKQWQGLRSVFTDDAKIWTSGHAEDLEPNHESVDAFVGWMQTGHDGARTVSVHHGHMPEIDILDADHASGIWALHDFVDRPNERAF